MLIIMHEGLSRENITAPSTENIEGNDGEKWSFLERLRSLPRSVKTMIFLAGFDISVTFGKRSLDYYDLKKIESIISENLDTYLTSKEKIERITQLFGNNANILLGDYRRLSKEKERLEKKIEDFRFIANTDFTKRDEDITNTVEDIISDKPTERRTESLIAGDIVASRDTISAEVLEAIAVQTYPEGWVEGEITSISQDLINRGSEGMNNYGLTGWSTIASCIQESRVGGKSQIIFYKDSAKNTLYENINEALSHEIAHANDWEADNELSFEERLNLLLAIADRVRSEDRYLSTYVESINNEDKQKELYLKCTEYWAEICSRYFGDSADNLNYKDVQIIEGMVKKEDPDFDQPAACTKRINSIIAYGYKTIDINTLGENIVKP